MPTYVADDIVAVERDTSRVAASRLGLPRRGRLPSGKVSQRNHLVSVGCWLRLRLAAPYLAKLLNAADCGLMHSGTRDVCSCSAMNLWISSAEFRCEHNVYTDEFVVLDRSPITI